MVDTQRFNLGPGAVGVVSTVARELARQKGQTSVIEITSYVPLDVESVARIMDSLHGDEVVVRQPCDAGICYFEFVDGESSSPVDIEAPEFLERSAAFTKNLSSLRNDAEWTRKVREHHELMLRASNAGESELPLAYFNEKTQISSARIQSILNDFGAQGHLAVAYDDDEDIMYTFPEFSYPERRFERLMGVVEKLETRTVFRGAWIAIAVGAAILLALVIFVRFIG